MDRSAQSQTIPAFAIGFPLPHRASALRSQIAQRQRPAFTSSSAKPILALVRSVGGGRVSSHLQLIVVMSKGRLRPFGASKAPLGSVGDRGVKAGRFANSTNGRFREKLLASTMPGIGARCCPVALREANGRLHHQWSFTLRSLKVVSWVGCCRRCSGESRRDPGHSRISLMRSIPAVRSSRSSNGGKTWLGTFPPFACDVPNDHSCQKTPFSACPTGIAQRRKLGRLRTISFSRLNDVSRHLWWWLEERAL
jgi:hypothetical protein